MPNLELNLLGGFSLRENGGPRSELKTQKGQALLCYLAITRKPAPRAVLAGLFWPDMPEAAAHMNLRKVLVRLRPLAPYLDVTRATLAFNLQAPLWLDVSEFEAATTVKTDIERLQRAVDLFQGDFLDGFYLDDAPLFEAWAQGQRVRLRALALSALVVLIGHFAEQAAYETAIGYANRVLALEPWHEETHREVMRLLALSGQRGAALVQYETCRGCLARELGVDPAPATVELYEQIRSGALEGAETQPVNVVMGRRSEPVHNLPAQTTAFVGREQELAALAAYLADPTARLVTIVGLGGMGKTRLALAAAAAQLDAEGSPRIFPQGVIFVALARLETPDQLVPALAEALNLRFLPGSEPKAQLLDYLRGKAMLLVLDNFEHLNHRAGLVDEILRAAGKVKVLVTSREKLNLQAEQLFHIGGMALPPREGSVEPATDRTKAGYSAIELFCEQARRVRPDFVLTAANQQSVVEICRLVQGMPLGIILAAAWLETYSPQGIAAEIRVNLDFLESEMADVPERQRSLRAAFNHSWRLVPEQERGVFQRLSTFRGGFTRRAAEAVAGAARRDLQGLVNKSLLAVSIEGRYDVHELLRQFATEKLAAAPEVEAAVRDQHSAYYCYFLSELSEHWHNAQQLETLNAVALESDNVQRAWQWALDQGDWSRLEPAMDGWGWFHIWRGRFTAGDAVFRTIVERTERPVTGATVVTPDLCRAWSKALTWQGILADNTHRALERLGESLSVLDRPELAKEDMRRERGLVLKCMADRYYSLDRPKARRLLNQSLAVYQDCGNQRGIASVLTALGHVDWSMGDYALAEDHVQASLVMHQDRGDRRYQARAISTLAWIYIHVDRLEDSVQLRRQALDLCQQLGDRSERAGHTASLAFSLFWKGEFEAGLQSAATSLALSLEMGHLTEQGFIRLALCCALLLTGQYAQAHREATQAITLTREGGDIGVEATVHWALGYLALVAGDCDEARSAFAESRRLYEEVQDNYLGLTLSGPGYAACGDGNFPLARPHFVEALQFALTLKDYIALNVTLPGVALWLGLTGAVVRAVEVWELALSLPFVAHSRWHAEVVGQRVEAAAATLTPDAREAARMRGRALDLWGTAERLVHEMQPRDRVPPRVPASHARGQREAERRQANRHAPRAAHRTPTGR